MYFFVVCFVLADYGGVENFSEKIDNRKEEYERKKTHTYAYRLYASYESHFF